MHTRSADEWLRQTAGSARDTGREGRQLALGRSDAPGCRSTHPRGFHIERVRDDKRMAEWIRVSEAGFGSELGCFYDAYARHGYGPEAFSLHYIGYLEDTPVTSGTLLEAGGCASIYDLSTPPTTIFRLRAT